ncbi:MAG TPA: LuxR C-terminal-related transcriptional regulator [Streptosporangiaceae bacterium]|jgi:DNA-binding CsgD family transcriptional regulator
MMGRAVTGGRTGTSDTAYIHDLEEHLRLAVFGQASTTTCESAVLLVRGALARGDRAQAADVARATQSLAADRPGNPNMTAAAAHVSGLLQRDSAALDRAARTYSVPLAQATAFEDAGLACAAHGDHCTAVARLRGAYQLYQQLGRAEEMARVRALLRDAGVGLHHWKRADRPAFGWDSLTDTERRIADLVAEGLSNREVAGRVFLSAHTVAFHLRHIFWKLDVGSRVQLARLVAEHSMRAGA